MHDILQQSLQALAEHDAAARGVIIVCAAALVYLLAAAWLALAARRMRRLTARRAVRIVALALLALLAARVLTHLVSDPRPYLLAHTRPLIPTARDNGFPSDHTLLAAFLAASLWWLERRWLPVFAVGALLVAFGRLGVGAHHTLDVAGSVAIVAVVALMVGALPLPAAWRTPVLPLARRAAVTLWRPLARRDPLA